jgi:TP901 family phage tail tape measure protein
MSAGAIKGGQVYVEIGADPKKFFAALNGLQKRIGQMGSSMTSLGTKMAGLGAATLAPFALAVRQGSAFQSTLLNIKASTGATATELDSLKAAALQMSAAMGVGPTQITQSFLELLKAGMSVEQVLGGAGKAAVEFAGVGQMDVAAAGVVMADAMKVFGVTADVAANALSSAADASSTSIEGISQAFSQVSSVAALANQSLGDTSAALAILANAGIKGSDAGTSLKTMLLRLMAPADEAVGALDAIGLSVSSFRNADGSMKPLIDIIGTLNGALGGMDQAAKDDIFRQIFGSDAIRAAAVLTSTGVEGFNAMTGAMGGAMSVGDKFKTMMSGLAGAAGTVYAALERLSIAATDALGPALMDLTAPITGLVDGIANFIRENEALVISFTKGVAIFTAAGLAIAGIGAALTLVAGAFAVVLSPVGALFAAIVAIGGAFVYFAGGLSGLAGLASTTFGAIYDAIVAGDLSGAMDALWAGLYAGWLRGVEGFQNALDPWATALQNTFTNLGTGIQNIWDGLWTGVGNAFRTFGAYLQGAFDNVINTALASWDSLEAGILKSWNYIQSFFKKGFDLKKENDKVDSKMSARARKRELERPGMAGRVADADSKNKMDTLTSGARVVRRNADARNTIAERERGNELLRDKRRQAVVDAEGKVTALGRGSREKRAMNQQAEDLGSLVAKAGTLDSLRELSDEFHTLTAAGRLTSEQQDKLSTAFDDATERIMGDGATIAAGKKQVDPKALADAAAAARESQAQVAGTFSSAGLGGMGFGSSLAQQQLDTLKAIKTNTDGISDDGAVAA